MIRYKEQVLKLSSEEARPEEDDPVTDPETRLNELVDRLRERGYRLTPQRVAVLKVLVSNHEHPTVEQVYERVKADFPMTSLATVYKTVALVKEMGEVLELNFGDDCNRYDANRPYPHAHLVCTRCKRIVDLDVAPLDGLSQEVAQDTGYLILSQRLDFFGICPQCQGEEEQTQQHKERRPC